MAKRQYPVYTASDYQAFSLYAGDSVNLYGVKDQASRRDLWALPRTNTSLQNFSASPTPYTFSATAGGVRTVNTTSVAGELYVLTLPASGSIKAIMWRSTDYGATFAEAFRPGDIGGGEATQIQSSYANSDRNFAEGFPSGVRTLRFFEYNVSGSRTTGGVNDAVQLWEWSESSPTWQVIAKWNTDGTTYFRHAHGVRWNPYTNEWWLFTGDSASQSAIWTEDPTIATYIDNLSFTAMGERSGFNVQYDVDNTDRFRTVDILFDANYAYYTSDTLKTADGQKGIWRCDHNNQNHERMNSDFDGLAAFWGWLGVKIDGQILFMSYINNSDGQTIISANRYIGFWALSEDGEKFKQVARVYCESTTVFARELGFFALDSKVYFGGTLGAYAAKHEAMTTVFENTGSMYIDDAVTFHPAFIRNLHPVWWQNSGTGDDSGAFAVAGRFPNSPFKTLKKALEGSVMTDGAQLISQDIGEFTEANISPNYSARPTRPAADGFGVQIKGQGTTSWVHGSGSALGVSQAVEAGENITLLDINYRSEVSGGRCFNSNAGFPYDLNLIDSTVGSADDFGQSRTVNMSTGTTRLYRSKLLQRRDAVDTSINAFETAGSADIELYSSAVIGGWAGIQNDGGTGDVILENAIVSGYETYGIELAAGHTGSVSGSNNILHSDYSTRSFQSLGSSDFSGLNTSRLSEAQAGTGADITVSDVNPFVDSEAGDFNLTDDTLKNVGVQVNSDSIVALNQILFTDPYDIGAFARVTAAPTRSTSYTNQNHPALNTDIGTAVDLNDGWVGATSLIITNLPSGIDAVYGVIAATEQPTANENRLVSVVGVGSTGLRSIPYYFIWTTGPDGINQSRVGAGSDSAVSSGLSYPLSKPLFL